MNEPEPLNPPEVLDPDDIIWPEEPRVQLQADTGFEAMLQHTCDIYHIVSEETSPGFNLPGSPEFSYPDEPDIEELRCHFSLRNSLRLVQQEPYAVLDGRVKLSVLPEVDIRLNDKIVHLESGACYVAESPVKIREHHITVMLQRTTSQRQL